MLWGQLEEKNVNFGYFKKEGKNSEKSCNGWENWLGWEKTRLVEAGFKIAVRAGHLLHYKYKLYIICDIIQTNHHIIW